MKYLVFGATGMAGNTIAVFLQEQGHSVIGFSRIKNDNVPTIIGDVRDEDFIKKIVSEGNYDIIINCIGILNQFAEENPLDAIYLNSYFPHLLVLLTNQMETKVIFMSTDCVFSGRKGGYTEGDFRDGETFYDRSKALGEINDSKNLTLRCSIIGPDIKEKGIGLLNWFMKQEGAINGYTNAFWTGITTLELAKVIEFASLSEVSGLINMVYEEPISKYELLLLLNKNLKENIITVKPFEEFVLDKSLVRTNFELNYKVPNYDIMVSELADWMKKHKEYYPHYKL